MKQIWLVLLVFGLMFSCQQPEKPSLRDQVMTVHDEVMPKMGELQKAQKSFQQLADSLAADSAQSARYRELADQMEVANQSMWDWMHQFNRNMEGSDEEVQAYMEEQLQAIEQVRTTMLQALATADSLSH